MGTVEYTYTVLSVDARTMMVEYTHALHGTMQVGVRRPKVGETLEQVIEEYSPAVWWAEQEANFAPVTPGTAGTAATVVPGPPVVLTPEQELALWRARAVCSPFQFRETLRQWGLRTQVQDIVDQVGEPLTSAFEYVTEVRRMSPAILDVFELIVMPNGEPPTEEDLDRFWTEAMQVTI